jgi:hypothetical protein
MERGTQAMTREPHDLPVMLTRAGLRAEVEQLKAVLVTIRDHATVHMGDYDIWIHDEQLDAFIDRALEPKP